MGTSAAALGCRFMTAYHGLVDLANIRRGEWVAVFGIGGVGLSAVQIASALGARVVAVSRSAEKLAQAKAEGAEVTLTASAHRRGGDQGGHQRRGRVAVDALGSSETTWPASTSLAKGGRHVQLGLTGKTEQGIIGMPVDAMVLQEITFMGSLGCPTTSYPGLLSMVASGALNPDAAGRSRDQAGQVTDVLREMTAYGTRGFNVITAW